MEETETEEATTTETPSPAPTTTTAPGKTAPAQVSPAQVPATPAANVPQTEHQQKMEVLRTLANAISDKWDQLALDMAIADNPDDKLEAIAKNKKLTPAMKAQQKSECLKSHEKKKARYKQLITENKINFPDLCLGTAVDGIDSILNWSVEDYRDLEGLVRLVNKTKAALPSIEPGKVSEAKWKAFGEKATVKMNPIVLRFVTALSPVRAQVEIDEKNGKFK